MTNISPLYIFLIPDNAIIRFKCLNLMLKVFYRLLQHVQAR